MNQRSGSIAHRLCFRLPLRIALTTLTILLASATLNAATYYVNPKGNDSQDGTSEPSAWQTVAKVNATRFQSGDQILFARGGEWRESLVASSDGASGTPILYAAYGKGAKPKFWGSDIIPNSGFQFVGGSVYKYVFKYTVNRHEGVAIDHQLLPFSVGFGSAPSEMIAKVQHTPHGYWIDDGFNSTPGDNILYINTGGSSPLSDGKLYTICVRDDVIQNAYKSHIIFRDLVVDESAKLELGYGFRIMGGTDIRLERCEAYRVGSAHFGIINADNVVGDHLYAAYAMPDQTYIRNSAYFINNNGTASVQLLDCTAEHLENFPGQRNYDVLGVVGDSTGTVTTKNLTCRGFGGGEFTLGGHARVNIIGGILESAYGVDYGDNLTMDGVTLTGNTCVELWGADCLLQNCIFANLNLQNGGPNGCGAPVFCRDKSKRNTIRFCTFVMSGGGNSACLTLGGGGTQTKFVGNIMLGKPRIINCGGEANSSDIAEADYNLYPVDATFTDANKSFAQWKTAGFDQHSLTGDPTFINPDAGDYSLKPGSPAIHAAAIDSASRPLDDATCKPRPSGDASIGAYDGENTR